MNNQKNNKKNNNIILKLNSSITRSGSDKSEVVELNTLGQMEPFGDGYKISYNGEYNLETVITVNKDNAMIERNDEFLSKIFIDKNKIFCAYQEMPFGTIRVKTRANEIENNLSADGGDLVLKYCVNLIGKYSVDNEISIHVKKA